MQASLLDNNSNNQSNNVASSADDVVRVKAQDAARRGVQRRSERLESTDSTQSTSGHSRMYESVTHLLFDYVFLFSLLLQLLLLALFYIVDRSAFDATAPGPSLLHLRVKGPLLLAIAVMVQVMQIVVVLVASVRFVKHVSTRLLSITELVSIYLATVLSFAGIYFVMFAVTTDTFLLQGWNGYTDTTHASTHGHHKEEEHSAGDALSIMVYFIYFSVCTITSCGFGDVTPATWYSQAVATVQMLIGVAFGVGIFALAVHHFQVYVQLEEQRRVVRRRNLIQRAFKWLRTNVPFVEKARHWLIRHLLLAMIVLISLNIIVLFQLDDDVFKRVQNVSDTRIIALCCLFQVLQFLFVVGLSIRLVKKIRDDHAAVDKVFLAQSYVATILSFAGLYFFIFLLYKDSFHISLTRAGAAVQEGDGNDTILRVLWRMVYFSMTAMTTTGYGDVYPRLALSRAVVTVQVLSHQLYQVVIFGLASALFLSKMNFGDAVSRGRDQPASDRWKTTNRSVNGLVNDSHHDDDHDDEFAAERQREYERL